MDALGSCLPSDEACRSAAGFAAVAAAGGNVADLVTERTQWVIAGLGGQRGWGA